jgi:hypothetical protein
VRNADYKYTEGLAKFAHSKDFGADVGNKGNSHEWLLPDVSHRERRQLGEINTLE